ncbi:hypothetical protein [Sphingomonas sp.]|uniref:hypothetical protein n=1 Tax=Sphingomonas sp. TaxID=28214 RepID=UPI001B2C5B2D|nr:hypothetical protein [Sphingomonas sp.]MBO9711748.1 hypothetical protein [Sphingomonas sp.]
MSENHVHPRPAQLRSDADAAKPEWAAPQMSIVPMSVTANSGTFVCDTATIASDPTS